MKELTIEEKAKCYDETIERAKKIHKYSSDLAEIKRIEQIFPELKESENIRIIKAIKYGLDHVFTNNTTVFEVTKEQCLAWLEKQGEHDPEYVRKDAFIEKAIGWIDYNNRNGGCNFDRWEKDFKKYMEGE